MDLAVIGAAAPKVVGVFGRVAAKRATVVLMASSVLMSGCGTVREWGLTFGPRAPSIPEPSMIAEKKTTYDAKVTDAGGAEAYVLIGYASVFKDCTDYFDALIDAQNETRFTGDVLTAGGTAAGGLAAMRKHTEKAARAVGRIAVIAGFGSAVVKSWDERALLTPYPAETKSLIMAAMTEYEKHAPPHLVTTAEEAVPLVAGYAEMCTTSGISRYAKQALSNATPKPSTTESGSELAGKDQVYAAAVSAAFGLGTAIMTEEQLGLLHYYLNVNKDAFKDAAHAKDLLANLPTGVAKLLTDDKGNPVAPTSQAAKLAAPLVANLAADLPAVAKASDAEDEVFKGKAIRTDRAGGRGVPTPTVTRPLIHF